MRTGSLRLVPTLLLGAGCTFAEDEHRWDDQLVADGPCWRVDLSDGLDESSTDELHDLYDCVNRQGAVQPLSGLVTALDGTGRAGLVLGIELAALVNDLPQVDVDLFGLAGAALDLMQAEDRPIEPLLELAVELVYGRPYATVLTQVDLGGADALAQGVAVPLVPVGGALAGAILDDGDAAPALLVELLDDAVVTDGLCTVVGLADTGDAEAAALGAALIPDLGDALARATDASNDRWSLASGNSLRDVVQALLLTTGDDGQTVLSALRGDVLALVGDDLVVANLRQTLEQARDEDRLAVLPAQLRYLAVVDVDGGGLSAGEDSALLSLLRLLHGGNQEVSCSIDLVVTELTVDLGNLSVALLGMLADQDPETAVGGVELLGELLGWGFTESTLELVADSGVCPAIDAQLVTDLGAVDRLSDEEVRDLLVVLLMVLDDVRSGEEDRLSALVEVAGALWSRDLVPPLEEALVDLGGTALASDLVAAVGLLLDPAALQVEACPTGSAPLDLEGLVGILRATLADRAGGAPIDVLMPLLQATLARDETWTALTNLGTLAGSEGARLREGLPLLASVVAVDPDLALVRDLAPLLSDPALYSPALRITEAPAIQDALVAPSTVDTEGPLPWLARLVTGGTLDSLLRTVDLVLDALDGALAEDEADPT